MKKAPPKGEAFRNVVNRMLNDEEPAGEADPASDQTGETEGSRFGDYLNRDLHTGQTLRHSIGADIQS